MKIKIAQDLPLRDFSIPLTRPTFIPVSAKFHSYRHRLFPQRKNRTSSHENWSLILKKIYLASGVLA